MSLLTRPHESYAANIDFKFEWRKFRHDLPAISGIAGRRERVSKEFKSKSMLNLSELSSQMIINISNMMSSCMRSGTNIDKRLVIKSSVIVITRLSCDIDRNYLLRHRCCANYKPNLATCTRRET